MRDGRIVGERWLSRIFTITKGALSLFVRILQVSISNKKKKRKRGWLAAGCNCRFATMHPTRLADWLLTDLLDAKAIRLLLTSSRAALSIVFVGISFR